MGYIQDKKDYNNNILEKFKDVLSNKNLPINKKVEFTLYTISEKLKKQLKSMGYCEKVELYKKYIEENIDESDKTFKEMKDVDHRTFRTNGNFISVFLTTNSNGDTTYYKMNSDNTYSIIDDDEYKKLEKFNEQLIKASQEQLNGVSH